MVEQPTNRQPEKPRVEPEIIPPGAPLRSSRMNDFAEPIFTQRIYAAKFGSFGFAMVALAIVAVVTVILALFLGALLLLVPLVGLLVLVAILSRVLGPRGRPGR
jgi:hypothetical protein